MLDILQQIYLTKKVVLISVYFLQEDVVQMVLIVNIIIEYLQTSNVNLLIKIKMFLEEHDFPVLEKT
jgi:hypothetical protein